jgi:hypothetical protein
MKIFEYRGDRGDGTFRIAATSMRDAYLRARENGRISGEVHLAKFRQRTRVTEVVRGSDEFDIQYELVPNPYDARAAWEGHWFETFGRELEHVDAHDAERVWTLLDVEEQLWIVAGKHHVNRVGYLLSTSPWRDPCENYVVA